ncbi:Mss4-like protein [Microdochium trichocladiopsis]|uniref:Mss4-like protein n=1 Tax=Microdochium trichocladiopsis TaxID=1682393 RepID=A0A9P9BVV4_9PEZI|nr:Mss4-like protein [Microdochium trichocladiopsis]KAH7040137.1 Mss4-like protein [Microdochium trichocladiopsis]
MTSVANEPPPAEKSESYPGGCHCGYIKYTVELSPPLYERTVNQCNCSACTRLGYMLVYPEDKFVTWHNNSEERVARYVFNTKSRDHMFCPKCGTSLGIDFREVHRAKEGKRYIGVNVRNLDNVKLDKLTMGSFDGVTALEPAHDTAGTWWDEEKQEMR